MAGFTVGNKLVAAATAKATFDPSAVYLIKLDEKGSPSTYGKLQYFPESITDSKAVDWQAKPIPGGSLPLYQWTGSGERTISFTAQFSTDLDLFSQATIPADLKARLEYTGQDKYNVDIRSAIAWLRSNMLPTYGNDASQVTPPNKLILYIPYSGIGIAGGGTSYSSHSKDSIVCVQTSCEVTWEKFFPSGYPRLASVSLAFAQIPQYAGIVSFPSITTEMTAAYSVSTPPANITAARTSFLGYSVTSVAVGNKLSARTQSADLTLTSP